MLYYSLLLYSTRYEDAIQWIKENFNTTYNIATIDCDYFTRKQYNLFQLWIIGITLLYGLLAVLFWINYSKITQLASGIRNQLSTLLKNILTLFLYLTLWQRIIILFMYTGWLAHHIYYCLEIPFSVDEVFAYNYFVHQSPLVPIFYYPEPNNHIFFNLFASFFDCFINNGKWVMRLPSLFANMVLLTVIFIYLFKKVNFNVALVATICCIISFPTSIYAIQGRGYMLMSLCTTLAAISFIEWKHRSRKIYLAIYIVSSIVGFYTHITFLYCFTGLFLWEATTIIVNRNLSFIKAFLWNKIVIVSCINFLYSPIIVFSGWKSLAENRWLVRNQTNFVDAFFIELLEILSLVTDIWHKVYIFIFFLLLLTGILAYKFRNLLFVRQLCIFLTSQMAGIIIVMLILRLLPPLRVWTYLAFWYPIGLSVSIYLLSAWLNRSYIYLSLSIFLLLFTSWQSIYSYQKNLVIAEGSFSQTLYTPLQNIIHYIVQKHPKYIFVSDHWLQFYLRNQQIETPSAVPSMDIDIPQKEIIYDFVIYAPDMLQNSLPATFSSQSYRLVAEFYGSRIYERSH
ncbi:hypothetical protein QNI16_12010 [Cytophagaceae bacterium YF14B1]|uniref:Glycosyltransferase RgtA/B/C/D-like domain-containing protein n=1 Tax=Xanthocytophaga flava TaxID=3048013 RepID=A0AAE3QPR7_9BACT|nr:hypothetical protein [Xanthocytophaga flavus]MDJ1481213.1 hypothetical protein [Xanthocytophaga flavus]